MNLYFLTFAMIRLIVKFHGAMQEVDRSQQCSILYTTEDRVYYTQSKISSLESSVQQFYSVSKRDLDREFPDYKEIDISILELLVQRYLSSLRPAHHFRILQSFPFIPFLKRDGIEINIDWQYQIDDGESIHIPLCLLLPFGKTEVNRLY